MYNICINNTIAVSEYVENCKETMRFIDKV